MKILIKQKHSPASNLPFPIVTVFFVVDQYIKLVFSLLKMNQGVYQGTRSKTKISDPRNPLHKYYLQRKRLFSRFDEGIELNEEMWYSVTPEAIAFDIAARYASKNVTEILDLYSGAGGNSIQFAAAGISVTAVELQSSHIDLAFNNARVYGVEDRIKFRNADVNQFLESMVLQDEKFEAIFLAPPWGGPQYSQMQIFDVGRFSNIIKMARKVSPRVGILVPKNVFRENVKRHFGPCEIESNMVCGVLKTKTIYFDEMRTPLEMPGSWRRGALRQDSAF